MAHAHPPLIIISGSIGSGKGTIVHALVHELDLAWIPTHTTRPMRNDDNVLSRRIFDTETNFMRHVARHEFVNMEQIAGHYYGLLREDLEKVFHQGRPAIVEMSVNGGIQLTKHYPHSILLFIQADEASRRERIKKRHMERSELETRMKASHKEEVEAKKAYDFLVENREDHPEAAIDAAKELVLQAFPNLKQ